MGPRYPEDMRIVLNIDEEFVMVVASPSQRFRKKIAGAIADFLIKSAWKWYNCQVELLFIF